MPAKLHDALLHHLVVACVLCKPMLLWQWLRMVRAMTSLACLTDETKLHIVSYCSALFSMRDNGIAVVDRLWNVMWRCSAFFVWKMKWQVKWTKVVLSFSSCTCFFFHILLFCQEDWRSAIVVDKGGEVGFCKIDAFAKF